MLVLNFPAFENKKYTVCDRFHGNGPYGKIPTKKEPIRMLGFALPYNNKHLMTGPKGNSEFCFPETLNVPRGEAEGNIEVEAKQNSLFPEGPVIKCFVIPSNSNIGKKTAKI